MRKEWGFSLVEVMVAAVVFFLVMVGLMSVFIAGSKHIMHARERGTSAQLGKFFIDPLQMDVRQDTWNSNSLDVSATPISFTDQTVNDRLFSGTYTVADGNSSGVNYDAALVNTGLRRLTATITWNE